MFRSQGHPQKKSKGEWGAFFSGNLFGNAVRQGPAIFSTQITNLAHTLSKKFTGSCRHFDI